MRIDPDRFLNYISEIDKSSISSDFDRQRVVLGLQTLLAKLQSPREKTTQLLHTNSYLVAAVKSLINLDLFGAWERDGGQPQTVEDLAQLTGAEPALLGKSACTAIEEVPGDGSTKSRYKMQRDYCDFCWRPECYRLTTTSAMYSASSPKV